MMWTREIKNSIMRFLWQMDIPELEYFYNLYIPEVLNEKRIIADDNLPEMTQEEKDLLTTHGKIKAIANYRRRTLASLVQANAVIDQELYKNYITVTTEVPHK